MMWEGYPAVRKSSVIEGNILSGTGLLCASSLFLSFTLLFFAPISIYLSNLDEFWFNLYQIFGMILTAFVVVGIILVIVGIVIRHFSSKLFFAYETLILAGGICVYIHSNFLNLKIGTLDGGQIDWSKYQSRMITNAICWIVIIVIVFATRIYIEKHEQIDSKYGKYEKAIPLMLTFLETVALITVLIGAVADGKTVWNKDIHILSDIDICDMGDENNIIVFVLDMVDATSMRQILEEEPEIVDELDGFTIYDNYTGLYAYTHLSMDNMINGTDYSQPGIKNFPKGKYIDDLIEDGYEISIYTGVPQVIKPELKTQLGNYAVKSMRFGNVRTKVALIYRLVACQYMPDIAKPYVWLFGDEFDKACVSDDEFNYYISLNANVRDIVSERNFNIKPNSKSFKIIHTNGGHDPFTIDADCNDVDPNWDDYYGACRGSLRIVQNYMTKMIENGTYDNSNIIITADPGWRSDVYGLLTSPLMLIKKVNERGTAKLSKAPVSQEDFQATILKLAGDDRYSSYGTAIMDVPENSNRERVAYFYSCKEENGRTGNFGLMKYTIKPEFNDFDAYMVTDTEISPSGRIVSHFDNCKTCKENAKPMDWCGWKMLVHYVTDEYVEEERELKKK